MKIIAHRGNITGPQPAFENTPNYILDAVYKGFEVEIDVWWKEGSFYLGHDGSDQYIPTNFLFNKNFWCHAKNLNALERLLRLDVHCFWHQTDNFALTNRGYIWTYPGQTLVKNSIAVKPPPEITEELRHCAGICSDRAAYYKEELIR